MKTPLLPRILLTLAVLAPAATAQATLPFNIRVQQGTNVLSLGDGGAFTIPADAVGVAASASITITYRGTATATINSVELTGSSDFQLSGLPDLPATLGVNQSVSATLRYQAGSSARATSRLVFNFVERGIASAFTLNPAGTAPEFAFSYIPQGGNATPILAAGTMAFPVTLLDATSTTVVVLTNRGSGAGLVNNITATGAAFQLSGLPLPATLVDGGRDLRFNVVFTPRALDISTGTLTVDLFDRRVAFNLNGAGSGPVYAYEALQDSSVTAILPNQAISLPDVVVGEKSSVVVRVRNTGNADGVVTTIGVQGAAFTLSDLPFLPLTLTPGAAATLTITFTPAQPGRVTGRLRVGNDSFDVSSTGLGATLTYSYAIGSTATTVANNGSVIFTPIPVGRPSSVRFSINNTGTAASSVGSISVVGTGTIFALSELPSLPASIPAGGTVQFTVTFSPTAVGAASATLRVDTQTFTLNGTGNQPAPLPEYRFEGASGSQEPQQQPAVGLTLAASYPLALTGTLTLAFNSDVFANDTAVQFSTGGRTIAFTVPANTTRAIFPNNQTQIRLQTGTVAGTITLTPSFVTDGGINLTPSTPPSLNLTVAQSAPRLLSVQVSTKSATGITLLVTGFATGRSITQMEFQFTPVSGENVPTTRLTLPVEPTFVAWYQGTPSQQFGSLFTATVPFTVQGAVSNVTNPSDTLQTVAVTLTNRQGTSAAQSVALR